MSLDPFLKRELDSLCRSLVEEARNKPANDFDRDTWKYCSSFDFWYGHKVGEMYIQCYGRAQHYYRENYQQGLTHELNMAITSLLTGHANDLRDALERLKQYPITPDS